MNQVQRFTKREGRNFDSSWFQCPIGESFCLEEEDTHTNRKRNKERERERNKVKEIE